MANSCSINIREGSVAAELLWASLRINFLKSKSKGEFIQEIKKDLNRFGVTPAQLEDVAARLNTFREGNLWKARVATSKREQAAGIRKYLLWDDNSPFTKSALKKLLQKPVDSKPIPTTDRFEVDYSEPLTNDFFLTQAYGTAGEARRDAEKKAQVGLFEAIFLNRGITGFSSTGPVTGTSAINTSMKAYQEFLFNKIKEWAILTSPELATSLQALSSLFYEQDGKKLSNWGKFSTIVKPLFEEITPLTINRLYRSSAKSSRQKLDAFDAWILLKNFDAFINLNFKDAILIKPTLYGLRANSDDKYMLSTKADKMNASWRSNEEIFVEDETSVELKTAVETTPIWEYDGSKIVPNSYLKYGDFLTVVSVIKSLMNYEAGEEIINDTVLGYFNDSDQDIIRNTLWFVADLIGKTDISNITMKDLIACVRLSPNKIIPVVFKLLSNTNVFDGFSEINKHSLLLTPAARRIIQSIHKGITGEELNSLRSLSIGTKGGVFEHICTLMDSTFDNPILYYANVDGDYIVRRQKDMSSDQLSRSIRSAICVRNSWSNLLHVLRVQNTYKVEGLGNKKSILSGSGTFAGVLMAIPVTVNNLNRELVLKVKPDMSITAEFADNPGEVDLNSIALECKGDIYKFTDDIIGLNFTNNLKLMEAFEGLYPPNVLNEGITGLLRTAARTVALSTVSQEMMGNKPHDPILKTISALRDRMKIILGTSDPYIQYNKHMKELNLVYGQDTTMITQLAKARQVLEGITRATKTFDSQGNDLSALSLSRLAGNFLSQWRTQCAKPNSATKGFSIMKNGVLRGLVKMQEAAGYSKSKKHTDFNAAEFLTANFLYDYIKGKQISRDSSQVTGNGTVALIAAVISDKSYIPRLLIDLNQTVQTAAGEIKIGDMDYAMLKAQTMKELGAAYKAVTDTIQADITQVDLLLVQKFGSMGYTGGLSIYNNFTAQQWFATNGLNLAKEIGDVVRLYNRTHRNSVINLIEPLHFTANKNGSITANSTLIALNQRMANPAKFDLFMAIKERQLVKDLLESGFKIDANADTLAGTEAEMWVHNGRMIICKVNGHAITSQFEYQRLLNNPRAFGITTTEAIDIENATQIPNLEINPELLKWNALDYWLTQEFLMTTVGTHANHPGKGAKSAWTALGDVDPELALIEEAARFNALHKRNVSYTASMHEFALDTLTGIPSKYTISVIQDVKDTLYNVLGKIESGVKPYDGAIFVDPITVRLENFSLGAEKAGINKKTFVHYYEEKTASGGIIKTCAFGLTNALCRISIDEGPGRYGGFKNLMYKLMYPQWFISDPKGGSDLQITVDLTQGKYHDIYYKEGDKFWKRSFDEMTLERLADGNLAYRVTEVEVNEKGEESQDPTKVREVYIAQPTSNWEMYLNLFKGWDCMEIGEFGIQYSELSLDNCAIAASSCFYTALAEDGKFYVVSLDGEFFTDFNGRRVEYISSSYVNGKFVEGRYSDNINEIQSQSDAYLPLKHSNIHYAVTEGAIKQGGANVNDNTKYKTFNAEDWNINTFLPRQIGIQLDKEHHADKADVSISTLVISACAAMGFSVEEAQKIYQTLRNMTYIGLKSVKSKIDTMVSTGNGEQSAIQVIQDILTQSIVEGQARAGSYDERLKAKLQAALDRGVLHPKVPFSGRKFREFVSVISSTLTKTGIKVKLSGSLSVLNPSFGLYRMYGDHTFDKYGSFAALQEALKEYDANPVYEYDSVNNQKGFVNRIRLGRTYKLTTANGIEVFKCKLPSQLYELRDRISKGQVIKVVEDITAGRDLGHYNVWFRGQRVGINGQALSIAEDVNQELSIYDLESTQLLFALREVLEQMEKGKEDWKENKFTTARLQAASLLLEGITTETVKLAIKAVQEVQQKELMVLTNGQGVVTINSIGGVSEQIRVTSTEIEPYELVMPMVFRTAFGLRIGDNVGTIKNDKEFFSKRLHESMSLDAGLTSGDYTYAFKRLDGKHVYVLDRKQASRPSDDFLYVEIQTRKDEKGLHRLFANGDSMYDMSSNLDFVYSNGDIEVIVTDNSEFYANNLQYTTIEISDVALISEAQSTHLIKFIESALKSSNKSAQSWAKFITATNEYTFEEDPEGIDLATVAGNNYKVATNNIEYLAKLGQEMHAAFLASLDIVAARIPAQSQQSFMAMLIVNFIEEDVNNAYVSTAQIWLQGSDFDVDAVTLMSYSVNKAGKIQTASPFSNTSSLELLKESLQLPFPTGQRKLSITKLPITELAVKQNLPNVADVNRAILENSLVNSQFAARLKQLLGQAVTAEIKEANGVPTLAYNVNNETVQNIRNIRQWLELLNDGWVDISDDEIALRELGLDKENFLALQKAAQWLHKKHNTYIDNMSGEAAADAAKNTLHYYMYKIASSPANLQEAQTSVDETTKGFKSISNSTPLAKELSKHTPGNVANKAKAIFNNQVGKDGIAVCAVGLKGLFAVAQYANWTLTHGTSELKKRLIRGGVYAKVQWTPQKWRKEWHPANIKNLSAYLGGDVEMALGFVGELISEMEKGDNKEDAALVLSALLSLATDNAKELALANLNAGIEMLPMYVYGIIMGMDINDITIAMTSKLGFLVRDLMMGNFFSTDPSMTQHEQVFSYLMVGPLNACKMFKSADEVTEVLIDMFNLHVESKGSDVRIMCNQGTDPNHRPASLLDKKFQAYQAIGLFAHSPLLTWDEKLGFLDLLRAKYLDAQNTQKFIDDVELYLYHVKTVYEKLQDQLPVAYDLIPERDALPGEKVVGYSVDGVHRHVNGKPVFKLKGNRDDLSLPYTGLFDVHEQLRDLSILIELASGAEEVTLLGQLLKINGGLKTKLNELLAYISSIEDCINKRIDARNRIKRRGYLMCGGNLYKNLKDGYQKTDENNKFDLITFLVNPLYREAKIKLYERVKHSFNLLDIISTVPHYFGYVETAALEAKSCELTSATYRFLRVYGEKLANELRFISVKDKNQFYSKMIDIANVYMRRHFMLGNSRFRIPIRAGAYQYVRRADNTVSYLEPVSSDGIIELGTREGDATYKYWVEHELIPNLQAGIVRDENGKLVKNSIAARNIIIQSLTPITTDRTVSHDTSYAYSLSINMIPKDDVGKSLLQQYQAAINAMNLTYEGIPVKELLWMYSQCVFNGKLGELTLTSLFEFFDSPLVELWEDYIADFDINSDIIIGETVTQAEIEQATAPYRSVYRVGSKYIYGGDNLINDFYQLKSTLPAPQAGDSEIDDAYYENELIDDFGDALMALRQSELNRMYEPVPGYYYQGPDFVRGNVGTARRVIPMTSVTIGALSIQTQLNVVDGRIVEVDLKVKTDTTTRQDVISHVLEMISLDSFTQIDNDGNHYLIDNAKLKSMSDIDEVITYLSTILDDSGLTILPKLQQLLEQALLLYEEMVNTPTLTQAQLDAVKQELTDIFTKQLNNGNYLVRFKLNTLTGNLESVSNKELLDRIVSGVILDQNCKA